MSVESSRLIVAIRMCALIKVGCKLFSLFTLLFSLGYYLLLHEPNLHIPPSHVRSQFDRSAIVTAIEALKPVVSDFEVEALQLIDISMLLASHGLGAAEVVNQGYSIV